MDEKKNREVEDMFDTISDDLEDNDSQDKDLRKQKEPTGFRLTGPSAIILGLGLVVIIVLLALLFTGGSEVNTGDLESLKTRVSQLEARLIRMDTMATKTGSLEGQLNTLSESLAKLESSDKSLKEQVDKLNQMIEKTPEKQAPVVAKKEVPSPSSQAKGRYHEVRRGETLYRIAKQYKLSLDQLRRMNNLKENQTIYAGQKLLVALEGK
ncbi:MAG: LysM peptidoglycan-binding domain-containing protein [Proteobacteria bacterium]|nr:LysM peptidoglycan-binding domain-containing protein [Pseudomonadota bacterium]